MPITSYPYQQYQGVWTLSQASDAVAQSKWPKVAYPYLYAWGPNNYGQLGLGNTTNYSSPKQVGALTNWSLVLAASTSSISIKTDGTLWSWGLNSSGQLGLGNTTNYSSPKQVGSLNTWVSLCKGSLSNSAIAIFAF